MNSSIIGKIDKARRYALEPERVQLQALVATFRGGHDNHELTLEASSWRCDCHFFETHATCAHVIAAQRILALMLPGGGQYEHAALPAGLGNSLMGKLDKARRYALEPERLTIHSLLATFRGSNDDHALALHGGAWHCACHHFEVTETCAHVMAAQRLLVDMIPESARYEHTAVSAAALSAIGV